MHSFTNMWDEVLGWTGLCWGELCCNELCCAVLCCAVLCRSVLCCADLSCAVLCCSVLCCDNHYCLVLHIDDLSFVVLAFPDFIFSEIFQFDMCRRLSL